MTYRLTAVSFFFLYGLFIPIGASEFMEVNFIATISLIFSCFVISLLLLLKRALILNILIAYTVFMTYLIRPYLNIFIPNLNEFQLNRVIQYDWYFNPSDAEIVYLGLLSLLTAWLLGLFFAKPSKRGLIARTPWVFKKIDKIIMTMNWRFFLILALLAILNFSTPVESWSGLVKGEGSILFAYGLAQIQYISIACLFVFLIYLNSGNKKNTHLILLVPLVYLIVFSVLHGSRNAMYLYTMYAFIFLLYYNFDRRIDSKDLKILFLLLLLATFAIFLAFLAQIIKPLMHSMVYNAEMGEASFSIVLDQIINNNHVYGDIYNIDYLYYSFTQLLHRLSNLQPQFLIMNEHFVHNPWEFFNPISSSMRTINDLIPGTLFGNIKFTINQLFNYLYFDDSVHYSSYMWSIQGVLYIYFGLWMSPVAIFLIAYLVGVNSIRLDRIIRLSPSFFAFIVLLFVALVENATMERIIPVNIVRPIASFLIIIFMYKFLYSIFPVKLRH